MNNWMLTTKRWPVTKIYILVRKWIDLWKFHKLEQSRIFGSKWLLLEFRRVDVWMEKSHSSTNFRYLFRRWLYKNNSSHVSEILHERWGDRRNNTCSCSNYHVRFGMKIDKNLSFSIIFNSAIRSSCLPEIRFGGPHYNCYQK